MDDDPADGGDPDGEPTGDKGDGGFTHVAPVSLSRTS
jgi:hypothetical protein